MPRPWVDSPTFAIDTGMSPSKRLQEFPNRLRIASAALSDAMQADRELVPPLVARAASARLLGKYDAEAKAWGRLLDQPWPDVILANCAYDLIANLFACSGVLLEGEHGPVLARNMDWWPERELARASVMLRFEHHGEPRFWIAGWPGSIGAVSGMSARGFALALNAVLCDERPPLTGHPTLIWLRHVLEHAKDFDHALRLLSGKPLLAPCLIALVGVRNDQRVIIERTPRRCELRWAEPGRALVVTNDYRSLDDRREFSGEHMLQATACGRFDALTAFFADGPPEASSDEALLFALTGPHVMMEITAQQMIFRPSEGTARLTVPRRLLAPGAKNASAPDDIG